MVATLEAVVAYTLVLVALDQWRVHTFEAVFFLLLLVLLPLYQYSLLRRTVERLGVRSTRIEGASS